MAKDNGFKYFAKMAWKKGNFISNTGRKSKNRSSRVPYLKTWFS